MRHALVPVQLIQEARAAAGAEANARRPRRARRLRRTLRSRPRRVDQSR